MKYDSSCELINDDSRSGEDSGRVSSSESLPKSPESIGHQLDLDLLNAICC